MQNKKTDDTVVADFVGNQIKDGQRGVIIGEDHENVGIVKQVVSEFGEMKKNGVSSLYVAYLPSEKQELLTKALEGNEKSQKEVRALMEVGWGFSHDAAQERYNALFEAHKQGLRVIAVDTPHSQNQISHDFITDKATGAVQSITSDERRLETSGAYIANQIVKNDDGKPFVVMVSRANTYGASAEAGKSTNPAEGGLKQSALGGIDARLTEAGIPTLSVDMETDDQDVKLSIEPGNGRDNEYTVTGRADNKDDLKAENFALTSQGKILRLNSTLENMVAAAQLDPEALAIADKGEKLSRSIADKLIGGKSFESQSKEIAQLRDMIKPLAQKISDPNEAGFVQYMANGMTKILENDELRQNIKKGEAELNTRDGKKMWNPNLADVPVSPLQAAWDNATAPQIIVPQEPAPAQPAIRQQPVVANSMGMGQ